MSVSVTRNVSAGLYVPFRGVDRLVSPVGTLAIDATVTGDASAGTVSIALAMEFDEFGFHPIWIPTRINAIVNNAGVDEVEFTYQPAGNERLSGVLTEEITTRVTVGGDNVGNAVFLAVPIEPDQKAPADVFTVRWETNTDTKVYHLHLFGVLYDAQAMSQRKDPGSRIDTFMAGVR